MSYVLDALRRAESERHRGSVPGLHAQTLPGPAVANAPPAVRRAVPWALAALALAAGVLGLLAWQGLAPGPAVPAAPSTTSTTSATTAPAAPSALLIPAAPSPAPPTLPPRATEPLASPTTTPPALSLPPVPPLPADRPADRTGDAPAATTPATPVAAASVPAAPARLPLLAELPEARRRELPTMNFGGAIDSPQPSARMLIVNGQVLHEGDSLAPGLTLQTIRLRSAVFEHRGQRFEVRY